MKKLGITVVAIIALIAVFAVTTGGSDTAFAALSTPANVTLEKQGSNYYITWTAVLDNEGYTVKIDGVEYDVPKNVSRYLANDLSAGRVHKVSVKALGADGTDDSPYCAEVDVVKADKLAAPANVAVNASLRLSWDAVTNASAYKVTVNGVILSSSQTAVFLDLSDKLYSTGDYLIKIKALGDNGLFYDSDYSADYVYTHKKTLAVPQNLNVAVTDGKVIASWDAVTYAAGYEVSVDGGTAVSVSGTTLDITDSVAAVADHSVKVRAKGDGNYVSSAYTSEYAYQKTAVLTAPVLNLSGTVVSWAAPANADRYSVQIRNASGAVYTAAEYDGLSIDLSTLSQVSAAGEYEVKVQALANGNYLASDISTVRYTKFVKLAAPALTITGTTVSWTAVPNAVNYTVTVNGRVRNATLDGLNYDFSADLAESGEYTVKVKANTTGYYTASDESSKTYTHTAKLAKTDVSAEGLQISWTAVVGAQTYAVTVDGTVVESGLTVLTFDVSDYCVENKTYTVGVYAEATVGFTAADAATVSVTGVVPAAPATKTYNLKITPNPDLVYFADGVKVENPTLTTIGSAQAITLPSTVNQLIVVVNAAAFTDQTPMYAAFDLTAATEVSSGGETYYEASCGMERLILEYSGDSQPASVQEGYEAIECEGKLYYYHVAPEAQIPLTIG